MADSPEFVRMFVALNIPFELHAGVERVQSRLRYLSGASAMRWTRAAQFHLTLEFLGDVDAARLDEVLAALRGACSGESPLALQLTGVGCFPSFEKPSVAWLGVGGDVQRLVALQRRIRAGMQKFEAGRDDPAYSPHMTIGRVKNGCFKTARVFGNALQREVKKLEFCAEWTAARVELVRSETKAAGAVYSSLGHVELD